MPPRNSEYIFTKHLEAVNVEKLLKNSSGGEVYIEPLGSCLYTYFKPVLNRGKWLLCISTICGSET